MKEKAIKRSQDMGKLDMVRISATPYIPSDFPKAQLQVRIIEGVPLLFTEDGKLVDSQGDLDVHAHMDDVLSCTVEVCLPKIEFGWPE